MAGSVANRPVGLFLTGPTATGKTELALEVADRWNAEVVNMDSAIVYRGMDIGTAKPDAQTRKAVVHHLIDICEPEDTYSAGRFAVDGEAAVRAINARGKPAIITGGTLLYLKALRDGLHGLPGRDESIRADIDAMAEASGWPAVHAQLAQVDPAAAARIRPTDRQRIQRALEVYRIAGKPLSALQTGDAAGAMSHAPTVALIPADRQQLRDRIADRFDRMVEQGFVDEVRQLRGRSALTAQTPAMRSVGYRQIWAYLDGDCDWQTARDRAVIATRQLAKRQLTWLRSDARARLIEVPRSDALDVVQEAMAAIVG